MLISKLVINAQETLGKRFILKGIEPNKVYGTEEQDGWKYKVIPYDVDIDPIIVKIPSNNSKPIVEKKDNELTFVTFENLEAKPYISNVTVDSKDNSKKFVDIGLSITATSIASLRPTKES